MFTSTVFFLILNESRIYELVNQNFDSSHIRTLKNMLPQEYVTSRICYLKNVTYSSIHNTSLEEPGWLIIFIAIIVLVCFVLFLKRRVETFYLPIIYCRYECGRG